MSDYDPAPERAAIWYVGAFGALGSVLLAGASIAGVDWTQAGHPMLALVFIGAAVVAAFTVVTLASRVIYPGCDSASLTKRTDEVQERLQKRNGGLPVTWAEIASEDRHILRALFVDEADFGSSPATLWAGAKGGAAADRAALKAMVEAANSWLARRRLVVLRYVTPVAALIVLIGGLAWKPLTAPTETDTATSAQPVPVQVRFAPGSAPSRMIGPGCTLRMLDGVAIAGNLNSAVTVAFAPQGDCPAAIVNLSPASATVQRN